MEVKIVRTANDNITKFELDFFLTENTSFEYDNIDDAENSPLAQKLFYLPYVRRIFIAQNFIAIDKYKIATWDEVQDTIATQIKEYLVSGEPVFKAEEKTKEKRAQVSIYAESTPNPSVLKFVANSLLVARCYEFKSIDQTAQAPLAKALFSFPFVKALFFDNNYISIEKDNSIEWDMITVSLKDFIREYLLEDRPIINDALAEKAQGIQKEDQSNTGENAQKIEFNQTLEAKDLDETSIEIVNILEEYIKPAVSSDGGNIAFKSYDPDTKKVEVILQGACSGCPSSTVTLKNGIETLLKDMLKDKVEIVEAYNA